MYLLCCLLAVGLIVHILSDFYLHKTIIKHIKTLEEKFGIKQRNR